MAYGLKLLKANGTSIQLGSDSRVPYLHGSYTIPYGVGIYNLYVPGLVNDGTWAPIFLGRNVELSITTDYLVCNRKTNYADGNESNIINIFRY